MAIEPPDCRPQQTRHFSVYYSQGVADAIAAELKEGKSEVVCDTGALIKNAGAVKVIDIFGNDTMTLVPITVG